jgi:hypothetical protein
MAARSNCLNEAPAPGRAQLGGALGAHFSGDALYRARRNAAFGGDLAHALVAVRERLADSGFLGRVDFLGRPSVLPSALARRRAARTRSWIMARSNSAVCGALHTADYAKPMGFL